MRDSINFGIGFITGRPNVCKIINSYCKYLDSQVKKALSEMESKGMKMKILQ